MIGWLSHEKLSVGSGYKHQSLQVLSDNADRHNSTAANQMWPGRQQQLVFQRAKASYLSSFVMADRPDRFTG